MLIGSCTPTGAGATPTLRVTTPCTRNPATRAPTFTVNCADDLPDHNPGDRICDIALRSGVCTLRAAIEEANASPGRDTIRFAIGAGPQTIRPRSPLEELIEAVTIDGSTQPGFGGTPLIELDGSLALASDGLSIGTVDATVRGLSIARFGRNGLVSHGRLVLDHVTVRQNGGAGVEVAAGGLTASDSVIQQNFGPGIRTVRPHSLSAIPISLTNTRLLANAEEGFQGSNSPLTMVGGEASGNGQGGILARESLSLSGVTVQGNRSSGMGGGISAIGVPAATLDDVTIVGNISGWSGGGLFLAAGGGARMTITGSQISDNQARLGGGLMIQSGEVIVDSTSIVRNRALIDAGGVFVSGPGSARLTLRNSSLVGDVGAGNRVPPSASAGGILTWADLVVDSSTIAGNMASGIYSPGGERRLSLTGARIVENGGRGLRVEDPQGLATVEITGSAIQHNGQEGILIRGLTPGTALRLTESLIENNMRRGVAVHGVEVTISGGRIGNNLDGGLYVRGSLDMTDVTVAYNSVGDYHGGGLHIGPNTVAELNRVTIEGNYADQRGGGILYLGGSTGRLTLRNVTISGNIASDAAGGLEAQGLPGSIRLINTTIAGNQALFGGGVSNRGGISTVNSLFADNLGGNCDGLPLSSLGHNLDTGGSCAFSAPGDLSNIGAGLGPLADNGGRTFTHALLFRSPAIDSGDPAECPDSDQRLVSRPQGPVCDVGAFEASGSRLASPTPFATPATPEGEPGLSGLIALDAHCRVGPGSSYAIYTSLPKGQEVFVEGRNPDQSWWWVRLPPSDNHCWVWSGALGLIEGGGALPTVPAPPLPTRTPTPKAPPPAQPPPPSATPTWEYS